MENLEKVQRIFAHIQSVNAEPMAQPGLSANEIGSLFATIACQPPADLLQLYQWNNGIHHLNAFLHFLPLQETLEAHAQNKAFKDEFPDFAWQESWLTILSMNGDVQVCLDLKTMAIYAVDVEGDVVEKIAEHYEHYLDAVLGLLEAGQYRFDTRAGAVCFDKAAWRTMRQRHRVKRAWR